MNKLLRYVGVAAVSLALPISTFAATFPNLKFSNNQTTTDCTAGQTVNFVARLNVPAGEVVEKVQVDVISDNLAPDLAADVGGTLGLQEGQHDVNLTVTCPQNTGYYAVEVRGAGIFGGQRSNSITDGVVSVNTFSNAIRVIASASGSGSGDIGGAPSWLQALLAQLTALIAKLDKPAPTPPPVPVVTPACAALAPYAGLTMGSNGPQVSALQGFLIANGQSIPALQYDGAAYGYFGVQTSNALYGYKTVNHCN